jgi:integral membrane protein (TIGR01906 family)
MIQASPESTRKSFQKPWLVAASILFLIGVLLLIPAMVLRPAEKKDFLLQLFELHADTEISGISRNSYPELAEALSSFLAGNTVTAQVMLTRSSEDFPAFSDKELLHLQDVKDLFVLSHRVSLAGVLTIIVIIFIIIIAQKGNAFGKAFIIVRSLKLSLGLSILFLLAGSVLTALDFNNSFTLMHRLVFTNDLWLLDPQADLLVQLMPEPFFIAYAHTALIRVAFFLIISLGITLLIQRTLYKGIRKIA